MTLLLAARQARPAGMAFHCLALVMACWPQTLATACPFCGTVGQSLSQRRDEASVVAVAEAESGASADATGFLSQLFRLDQLLRGNADAAIVGASVTARVVGPVAGTAVLFGTAAAASRVLTVMRTSSDPARARAATCAIVPAISAVSVLVMDWTAIGAPPPITTPPTETGTVGWRVAGPAGGCGGRQVIVSRSSVLVMIGSQNTRNGISPPLCGPRTIWSR